MSDALWPSDFSELEVQLCEAPMCEDPAAQVANSGYPAETLLCEKHFQVWCRAYDQRPAAEEDEPAHFTFQAFFDAGAYPHHEYLARTNIIEEVTDAETQEEAGETGNQTQGGAG